MIIKWVAMLLTQMSEYNANIMKAKALVEGLAFEAYVQMILKTKNIIHINTMHIHVKNENKDQLSKNTMCINMT
jgi:hypothetical protein